MFSLDKRPNKLSEFVGQEKIVEEFINRSKDKEIDIPQVILMSGKSGLGKTSLIFILTKLLSCSDLKLNNQGYYEPCNECTYCKNVNEEKFSGDVEFIDCSQYKKEDVINLHKKASIAPMYGTKNKIFIMDEFQDLGNASTKGAVFKLLEKKRKNVYFFLSTMNFDSIPKDIRTAIKRRCQVYNFKEVNYSDLSNYLFNICNDYDNIPEVFFEEGIHIVAQNSEGSPGVAISNLERCIKGKIFNKDDIEKELSFISEDKIFEVIQGLLEVNNNSLYDLHSLNNLESFYFKSKKIILNANIYKITNRLKEKWQEKSAKSLSQYNNLFKLLQCYNLKNINSYYFDKDIFYNNILDFYHNNSYIKKNNTKKRIIKGS